MKELELSPDAIEAVWRRVRGEAEAPCGTEERLAGLYGQACRQAQRLQLLARCLGCRGGQTTGRLAGQMCAQARQLAAIYFLQTGCRVATPEPEAKQKKTAVPAQLRAAVLAAQQLAADCRKAAEQYPAHRTALCALARENDRAAACLTGLVPLWL